MAARRRFAATAALVVLALDLIEKGLEPTPFHHARSAPALALTAGLALTVLWVAPRAPSVFLAVTGGVAAGGALGNLVSALVWRAGVPDPLVHSGYAFNLADVAVVLGDAGLLTAAVAIGWAQRHRLRAPV